MKHVIFNGQTGTIGRFLSPVLHSKNLPHHALESRLEAHQALENELQALSVPAGSEVTLIPLAAIAPIAFCEKNPSKAYETNVTNTVSLAKQFLHWTKANQLKPRILFMSTGHVYRPKSSSQLIQENDPLGPRSVYAKTKLEAENQLKEVSKKESCPLLIMRQFGVVGPQQLPTSVLPGLIKRATEKNFSHVQGLHCVRDYLDTRDIAKHLSSLCVLDWSQPPLNSWVELNMCSGIGISIKELFLLVLRELDMASETYQSLITPGPARPDDVDFMVGNPSRLSKALGRPPRITPLEQTIRDAIPGLKSQPLPVRE
ncbi:MAG: GDP-6-deoxy-D-talose 4-dehydrogenase [Elusimicrobia bacterium]|nr:GDP-6-deoxy-D-talose 4-dehydrogenase [Elusimicrobiota bacterium]